jgi:uncharacterized protein (TIGR00725 family)
LRAKLIAVIGDGRIDDSERTYHEAVRLGGALVDAGYFVLTGGLGGVMEAACKGARESKKYSFPRTIGLLPWDKAQAANAYVDIVIPTSIGFARNVINASAASAVVAIGGGNGTLSEIAFAWQFNKKIIAYSNYGGWAAQLAGTAVDSKRNDHIIPVQSAQEVVAALEGPDTTGEVEVEH